MKRWLKRLKYWLSASGLGPSERSAPVGRLVQKHEVEVGCGGKLASAQLTEPDDGHAGAFDVPVLAREVAGHRNQHRVDEDVRQAA